MLCPFCQLTNSGGDTCRFCGASLSGALPSSPRAAPSTAPFAEAVPARATLPAAVPDAAPLSTAPAVCATREASSVWRLALREGEPPLLAIAFWCEEESGLCLAAGGADGGVRLFCAPAATGGTSGGLQPGSVGALSPRVLLRASNKTRDARCVAFAPASGYIAGGYGDGTVRLRGAAPDVTGRRDLRAPISRNAPVNALAFSADETLLAIGFGDGTVALWRIADGKRQTITVEDHCGVTALAFSPDGAMLAIGADNGAVGVWEVAGGINRWTQTRHEFWIRALAFSPNSGALASGGYGGVVRVWAAQSGVELQTLAGHDESVSALAFAPDNRTLLSGGLDKTVRVWDSWTGAAGCNTRVSGAVTAIALRPAGLAAAGAKTPDALAVLTTRDITLWRGSGPLDWGALEFASGVTAASVTAASVTAASVAAASVTAAV